MDINQVRKIVGIEVTGDPSFDGTLSSMGSLSANDKIKITNGMKAYIRDHPDDSWTDTQKKIANKPDVELTQDYTFGDMASDFVDEAANQAVSINDAINPFSEKNRNKVLWIAIAGVALYFIAPVIIKAFMEGKATKTSTSAK